MVVWNGTEVVSPVGYTSLAKTSLLYLKKGEMDLQNLVVSLLSTGEISII